MKTLTKLNIFLLLIASSNVFSQPSITNLSTYFANVNASISINGSGFSTIANNNFVYFGAVRANVTLATATALTVTVPYGASYSPISVTVNGLTAYSLKPFNVTFASNGLINGTTFPKRIDTNYVSFPTFTINVDLDNDGLLEIISGNGSQTYFSVFHNTTTLGKLSFDPRKNFQTFSEAYVLANGDLDGDGKQDIITSHFKSANNSISIHKNVSSSGNINFSNFINIPINFPSSGSGQAGILVNDIDSDGKPDIIVANYYPSTYLTILRNTSVGGNITFATPIFYSTSGYSVGISCGDLNNDGKPEIALTTPLANNLSIFKNESTAGNISFSNPVNFNTGTGPHDVQMGDLDGDGKLDLAVTNYGTNTTPNNTISVLRNVSVNGANFNTASFTPHVEFNCDSRPRLLTISDLNGDGKPDITVANVNSDVLSVLRNNSSVGNIAFATKYDYKVQNGPYNVSISDLDNDGLPEIVTPNYFSGSISILTKNSIINSPNTVVANFSIPDTVCVNEPVFIQNLSSNATTFKWNFCNTGSNVTISGVNLGNINGSFSRPVFLDYVFDNGNYYGFLMNYEPSTLVRLDFGNSLLNTPTAVKITSLNSFFWNPAGAEDLKIIKQNGVWNVIVVGGSTSLSGTVPAVLRINFGVNITNLNPVVTNWGNVGNMEQPHQLHMWQELNVWYGLVFNSRTNTLTRINFSSDFGNTPTGVNLGNIGSLNYPSNFEVVNDNGQYSIFVTNTFGNSISRLDFGASLLNNPVGVNLGMLSGNLNLPRGIKVFKICDGFYGYILNQSGNDIALINFGSSLLNVPSSISLGNFGNLGGPISFSNFFTLGNSNYCFVPNANNNTISRLKFEGCSSVNDQYSNLATPSPIIYTQVGNFTVSLKIDEGLISEKLFCKKITVVSKPSLSVTPNTSICFGETKTLNANGANYYSWSPFVWLSDSTSSTHTIKPLSNITYFVTGFASKQCFAKDSIKVQVGNQPKTQIDTITACNSYFYQGNTITSNTIINSSIKNGLGCDSVLKETHIIINKTKRYTLNKQICSGTTFWGFNTSRTYDSIIKLKNGCDSIVTLNLTVLNFIYDTLKKEICFGDNYKGFTSSIKFNDTIKSIISCDTVRFVDLIVRPRLQPILRADTSICSNDSIILNPGIFNTYLWQNGSTAPGFIVKKIGSYYVKVGDNFGCFQVSDTFRVLNLYPLPVNFLANSINACIGDYIEINGFVSYLWNTGETTNKILLNGLSKYELTVRDLNRCIGKDSINVTYNENSNFIDVNVFSPNGDGVNDMFNPIIPACIISYKMNIFSRSGQLLYTTLNPYSGWNGRFNGQNVPQATYYYIIEFTSKNGKKNQKSGGITVLY